MKVISAALLALVLITSTAFAASVSTITYKLTDGNSIVVSASTIDTIVGKGNKPSMLVMTGSAHFKAFSKTGDTTMSAEAKKITVLMSKEPGNAQGAFSVIKSAEMSGPVTLIYTTIDPTTKVKAVTTATSDNANYDGTTRTAYLTGNVKILNENPTLFEGPAVMTGDKATIDLTPGQSHIRVETSPGVSTIEATPKGGASQQK